VRVWELFLRPSSLYVGERVPSELTRRERGPGGFPPGAARAGQSVQGSNKGGDEQLCCLCVGRV